MRLSVGPGSLLMWGISLTARTAGTKYRFFAGPHAMQRTATDPGGAIRLFRRERRPHMSNPPGGVEPARGLSAPHEEERRR